MLSVHSETKHFVCQHCGSGFSTSSGVSRHQKQNRCSGLKALGENVNNTRQNTTPGNFEYLKGNFSDILFNSGSQVVTEVVAVPKVEAKISVPGSVEKNNTSIIQSMQYLQNIAAASTFPGLGNYRA